MATHHQLNDEELIRMYLHTQQNNYFEVLYNRYVSKVYSRCLSLTKDVSRAEDYTHDIFLRVYGNLGKFKEHSAFSTWLYSISYNYCMDQIRSANRTLTVSLDDQQEHTLTDSGDNDNDEAQFQQLAVAMNGITPEETRMLQLKYEEGLDIRAIAEYFSLKDSAVKMRLKRTRDKIRRLYGEQYA
jgi:RNA polymerase sigma factor (sigma-70 family)